MLLSIIICIKTLRLGSSAGSDQTPCDAQKMDASQSSFVCVCNATYCDDLPPLALPEQVGQII